MTWNGTDLPAEFRDCHVTQLSESVPHGASTPRVPVPTDAPAVHSHALLLGLLFAAPQRILHVPYLNLSFLNASQRATGLRASTPHHTTPHHTERRSQRITAMGNRDAVDQMEIPAIVKVSDDFTSQFGFARSAACR